MSTRRTALKAALSGLSTPGLGLTTWVLGNKLAQAESAPRVIEMQAQRFEYRPKEIHLRRGERVLLQIRSLDFVHGFNLPELGLRADLPPGQVTSVALQVARSGRYEFLCDNFCGDGHERMSGQLIVSD